MKLLFKILLEIMTAYPLKGIRNVQKKTNKTSKMNCLE